MKAYYKSHVGLVREQNEDTVLVDDQHGIFILADGMGGHQAGEVASLLAATTLRDTLADLAPSAVGMQQGFRAANAAVYQRSLEESGLNGMGTTMTALWNHDDHILLGHGRQSGRSVKSAGCGRESCGLLPWHEGGGVSEKDLQHSGGLRPSRGGDPPGGPGCS